MSAISIDFNLLRDVASKSRSTAGKLDSYADAIPGKVTSPLGSLTGGASSYTSTASSLAGDKAAELRSRAGSYRSFAQSMETFATDAQNADAEVKRKLSELVDAREDGLSWWDKISYGFFQLVNDVLGDSDVGTFLRNVLSAIGTASDMIKRAIKGVFDWFKHGAGRYVLDAFVSVLGAVGAVVAVIGSFPISGFVSAVMMCLTVFVAADKILDAVAATAAAARACSEDSTDPGLARYHGSATNYAEFAKRFTNDATLQGIAARLSAGADVADFITSIGGFFSYKGQIMKKGEAVDATVYTLKRDVVVSNLNKQIGRNALTYKDGPMKGLPQPIDGKLKFNFDLKVFGLSADMSAADKIKSIKCMTSFTRDATRIDENFRRGDWFKGIKDLSSLGFSDFATGIKAPGTMFSIISLKDTIPAMVGN